MTLLRRIREHAAARPSAPALAWGDAALDYAGLAAAVDAAGAFLRGLGVRVIAIDVDNNPAWPVLDIAAQEADLVLVPVPPFFSASQVAHLLAVSGAGCVVHDTHSPRLDPAAVRGRQTLARHDVVGQPVVAVRTGGRVRAEPTVIPPGVTKITFTSGTTGTPKGVMLAWRHLRPVVAALAAATRMGPDDRHLCQLPHAVLLENIGGLYVPLWTGACCVLSAPTVSSAVGRPPAPGDTGTPAVDGAAMAYDLAAAGATTTILTPGLLRALTDAEARGVPMPRALRFVAVGGAAVSPRLLARARAAGLPVFEGYGLSECASVVCLNTPGADRPGSVGRPLPHVAVSVAADGEILVDGEGFAGYLGEPTRASGPWPTGDLGHLDGDGYLFLRGRRRNVFITAFGRNVSPEWVERELTAEPAIGQAVLFGEARPFNTAVMVTAPGAADADVELAVDRVNRDLPDYARVGRWLKATAPFSPDNGLATANGRPRRDAVWQAYADRITAAYTEVQTS